jgi:1D-myo-inositol 3-kinase
VQFDYTTVGHVTVDVLADGSRRPGGTAFYSALQASRLGLRTLIHTRGAPAEIERLLAPYRAEVELAIEPAAQTTTLHTTGSGLGRRQRVLAWAGPIEDRLALDTAILHLAPVARETADRGRSSARFVGLTPQGLAREWSGPEGEVSLSAPDRLELPEGCDAIVLSEVERVSCAELISRAREAGALVAVTAGHRPTTVLLPGGEVLEVPAPERELPAKPPGTGREPSAGEDLGADEDVGAGEDLGAGDVFAAAFFIALSEGRSPHAAAAFASTAAALRIARPGTEGIAGREAIESRAHGDASRRL